LIKRRLAALVGHPYAGLRHFGAHLEHHALDFAPDRHVAAAPYGQAGQMRQNNPGQGVEQFIIGPDPPSRPAIAVREGIDTMKVLAA
jgi:hypothetical protein